MPRRGKDPTPQGRGPRGGARLREHLDDTPGIVDTREEKLESSEPGPDLREDGVYWYGYEAPVPDRRSRDKKK